MPIAEKKPAARSPRCYIIRVDANRTHSRYHAESQPFWVAKRIVRELNTTRAFDERFYLRTIDA